MPTEEHYMKLINHLQREIENLDNELLGQGEKLDEKINLLKQSIPKTEHDKIITILFQEYERKLSKIETQPP